jgi:hypothetical protein
MSRRYSRRSATFGRRLRTRVLGETIVGYTFATLFDMHRSFDFSRIDSRSCLQLVNKHNFWRQKIMRALLIAMIPLCAGLAGCVSDPSETAVSAIGISDKVYVRADGKRLVDHPALAQQLEVDRAVCKGRAQTVGLETPKEIESKNTMLQIVSVGMKEGKISDIMQGCMAERGYLYMTVAEAEARADRIATVPSKKKSVHTAMN